MLRPLSLLRLSALTLAFALIAPGLKAWIITASSQGTTILSTIQDPPHGSWQGWVYLPNLTSTDTFYFCLEVVTPATPNTTLTAEAQFFNVRVDPFNTTEIRPWTTVLVGDKLGAWHNVPGQSALVTLSGTDTYPTYVITHPSSPFGTRQYKTGYRVYGYLRGGYVSDAKFVTVQIKANGNGKMKAYLSNLPLFDQLEPDVVALPVANPSGEPSITVGGVADKVALSAPASFTLNWNSAGAPTRVVTGGSGAGALPANLAASATSYSFTSVPQSKQTYVLETQGSASVAWRMGSAATWEIFRGSTLLASGTDANPTLSTAQIGAYVLKVNGLEKTAEDETVNVSAGFLRRKKTIEVTVGAP
jgi:hypothetical protein